MDKPAMIAIETRYIGPTDRRGSRVAATTANGHRMVIAYDPSRSQQDAHRKAAECLAREMGWTGKLVCGSTKAGYVFVFVD